MTQDEVAVLDFGSSKITALIGQRGINNTFIIDGKGETEYAGFGDGEFFRPEQLGQAIAHAINIAETAAKTKITKLYIGVPGDFTVCVCKNLEVSFTTDKHKITENDVENLHNQGDTFAREQNYVLINVQPIYYDLGNGKRCIDPVGMISGKLGGLISYLVAEGKFIDIVSSVMNAMGIESFEFVSSVLAETLFLFDDAKRDQSVILIDVGYITTTVSVSRGDGLLSLHSFGLGGGNISGDLANYFQIPFAEAEALKRKVELTRSMGPDDNYELNGYYNVNLVNEIVRARIRTIAMTALKCLNLNEYEIPANISICLTGGGITYMRGAKEILSEIFRKRVEVVAPRVPQMEVPGWSSSLGLLDLALNLQTAPKKNGFFARLLKKLSGKSGK